MSIMSESITIIAFLSKSEDSELFKYLTPADAELFDESGIEVTIEYRNEKTDGVYHLAPEDCYPEEDEVEIESVFVPEFDEDYGKLPLKVIN